MNDVIKLRSSIPFWIALLFIVGWTLLLVYVPPGELVKSIGVGNSYVVAFLVSLIGAFSSFTTFSTYPAIITLAAGQVNPLVLGVTAGLGLALGDTFFYFFGMTARGVTSEKFQKWVEHLLKWLRKRSDLVIQIFIFFYVGFTPFPNNVLTGLLALDNYPFRKVAFPLVLGDMVLPILAAYLSYRGVNLFFNKEEGVAMLLF